MTGGVDAAVADALPGDARVALFAGGRLVELKVARGDGRTRFGAVHLGRVLRRGAGAAFVDIGGARPGLLDLRPGAAAPSEGAAVLVQVDKAPVDDKGAGLTADVVLPGRRLMYTPMRPGIAVSRRIGDTAERQRLVTAVGEFADAEEGFILRRAAAGVDRAALEDEAALLRADWRALMARKAAARPPAALHPALAPPERALLDHADSLRRVVLDTPGALASARRFCARWAPELEPCLRLDDAGEVDFEAEIEAALARRVALPGGGDLVVEPGETLTAIDVNPGPPPAGGSAEQGWLEAGLAAVPEIARQIRLRNLAGLLVVDFPRLRAGRHRRRLVAALRRALADDPMAADVLGMTAGGLIEITRRRGEPPLDRVLRVACGGCDGDGRMASAATVAFAALRAARRAGLGDPAAGLALVAAPVVLAALDGVAAEARAAVEAGLGRRLELRPDPAAPADRFELGSA